jgi:hypothetical protein
MGLLVVESAKTLVALKDPSILPFLPSATMDSPVTDYGGDSLGKLTRKNRGGVSSRSPILVCLST